MGHSESRHHELQRDGYQEMVLNWYQFLIGQFRNTEKLKDKQYYDRYLCHFNSL